MSETAFSRHKPDLPLTGRLPPLARGALLCSEAELKKLPAIVGDGFAVDASLIAADANKHRSLPSSEWKSADIGPDACRATVHEIKSGTSGFGRQISVSDIQF